MFWWTTFFLHRPSLPGDWHYVLCGIGIEHSKRLCACAPQYSLLLLLREITVHTLLLQSRSAIWVYRNMKCLLMDNNIIFIWMEQSYLTATYCAVFRSNGSMRIRTITSKTSTFWIHFTVIYLLMYKLYFTDAYRFLLQNQFYVNWYEPLNRSLFFCFDWTQLVKLPTSFHQNRWNHIFSAQGYLWW